MTEDGLLSDERAQTQRADPAASTADAAVPTGYGARLSWERQRAGLGIGDVAARLRLHPKQVQAIESEDLRRLPELAYVRGFLRSYARVLNIDAGPLLADLSAKAPESAPRTVGGSGHSAVRTATHERRFRQWIMGVAVAGLIGLGVVGWQSMRQEPTRPGEASPSAGAATAPATFAPTATPPSGTDSAAAATASPVSPAVAAAPMLRLRFNGLSWAEVTDADGRILWSQLSSAGAEHALDGEAPLSVVIGDAGKTSVEVRGEAFNLQPFTRNNVARFTVN